MIEEDPRRTAIRRTFIVLVVLACIAALATVPYFTRRGDDQVALTGGSSLVELLTPTADATLANQQAQVGIDLVGIDDDVQFLVINGTPIPEDQLVRRPDLSAVFFTPGQGKVIEALSPGTNCAEATIRPLRNPDEQIQPVKWCFRVA